MPRSRKPADTRARRRPRVEALASLPLFFRLEGRKVIVAGGSDAAAWKAELLAASGANVHVFAHELDAGLRSLLDQGSTNGRYVHHQRPWSADCFQGAALAIADAKSEGEAQAFYCAARAAGVPVNVIDTPRFCEFQFGSIVNRSPVVIGISTNGVAPILGQAIRRRIEALLPLSLRTWARFAGAVRGRVLTTLKPGTERRRFWEKYTELAFSGKTAPEQTGTCAVEPLFREAAGATKGQVSIIGMVSGDAEDLTLKAVRALQSADVILYDEDVADGALELARREAERRPVSRRAGRKGSSDDEYLSKIAALVGEGRHVVRLKTVNPPDTGAADPEPGYLAEKGLSVTVVPGIAPSSAEAAEHSRPYEADPLRSSRRPRTSLPAEVRSRSRRPQSTQSAITDTRL